jgi:drug/metabolite transporter (DMT)-like permease
LTKALGETFSVIQIVFMQHLVGFICIFSMMKKNKTFSYRTPHLRIHLIRDVLAVASFIFFYYGIKKISYVNASTLAYTSPFFTPFIWKLMKKEKIEKEIWWAILLGFFGILLILKPGITMINLGVIISLAAAVVTSLSLVLIHILNKNQEPSSRIMLYYFTVSSLLLFPCAVFFYKSPSFIEFAIMAGIGICTFLGQLFLTQAYRFAKPAFLSPLSYSMLIFVMLINSLVFHSSLDVFSIAGTFFVIIGGILTFILKGKKTSVIKNI